MPVPSPRAIVLALLASGLAAGCTTATVEQADPADDAVSERALSNAEETAFNYFVSKGLTKEQAAGIVGNLIQESSVQPTIAEYGGGPGRGIAQWSVGGRWDSSSHDNVTWFANSQGTSRWLLGTQLDFTWYELTTFSGYGLSQLRASTTVTQATVAFMTRFEACGACAQSTRIADANHVLAAYGHNGSGSGSGSSGAGTPTAGATCYSGTLDQDMPENACVESKYDDLWYQCSNGAWVDRWTDPDACNGVHPL